MSELEAKKVKISGRYTSYVPTDNKSKDRRIFLERLFKGDAITEPPFKGITDASAAAVKAGEYFNILRGQGQGFTGAIDGLVAKDGIIDTGVYGANVGKVDLTYQNRAIDPVKGPEARNIETVKWSKAGDPANPYLPDISSPGPGLTDGVDKKSDPQISVDASANKPPDTIKESQRIYSNIELNK
jgi:hypothetical protein